MTRKAKAPRKRKPFIRRGAETNDVFLEDLRGSVWNSYNDRGLTWKDVAIKADLNVSTVSNFAYGEVRRPMFRTVFRIAEALDIRLKIGE